jgi:hypothetical protein
MATFRRFLRKLVHKEDMEDIEDILAVVEGSGVGA